MRKIEVMGSGYARPQHRIDNQDLETILDTSDEWIVQRTGIHSRYVSTEETTSMLAARAAQAALDNAGVDKEAIALLIVATLSGDQPMPSTACLVQEQLGMMDQDLMAFDLNAACSGFLFALETAAGFLSRGRICIHLSSSGYWSKGTDICRSSRFFVAPGFSALSRTAEGDMPCRLMIITWVRVLYFAGWTLAARAQPLFRPFGCGPSFRNGPISEKLFYLCQIFCGG